MTRSYCQDSTDGTAVPDALRWMRLAVIALLVVLAALPVAMVVQPGAYEATVLRANPTLDAAGLATAFSFLLWYTVAIHAVFGVIVVWMAACALRGHRWARIALTIAMIVATLGSIDSAMGGPEYYVAVIASDVLHLLIIALLWAPGSTREFFAAHRRPAASVPVG